jgi:hypothetical protein
MEWDDILAEAIWSEKLPLYKGDQEAPFGVSSFQFYFFKFSYVLFIYFI